MTTGLLLHHFASKHPEILQEECPEHFERYRKAGEVSAAKSKDIRTMFKS